MMFLRAAGRLLCAVAVTGGFFSSLNAESVGSVPVTATTSVEMNVESDSGKKTDKVGVSIGQEYTVGGSVQYGDSNGTHGGYSGQAGVGGNVGVSVETGPGSVSATAGGGVSAEGTVSIEGQVGDDRYNLHGQGEIKVSAELVAELKAQLAANADGAAVGVSGEIGASLSSEGVIKGGVMICGVPVDVVLSGTVSVGASASAGAGAEFNARTGKLKLTLEASAVLGVGVGGSVQVEVGVAQLAELLVSPIAKGTEKLVLTVLGDDTEYVQDLLQTKGLREKIEKIIRHELGSAMNEAIVKSIMELYDNGASPGLLFKFVWAVVAGDAPACSQIMSQIREEIANAKDSADPLDSEPGADSNDGRGESDERGSGSKPVFRGVTPFKAY